MDLLAPARTSRPWTVLAARRALRRLIERDRPSAVICHGCWPHALFASTVRRAGVPLIFWQHDMLGGLHWIDRLAALTPPDLALVNSHATAETTPRVFPSARREVLYSPVLPPAPPGDARDVRRGLGAKDDDSVIAMTCRLEAYKGHALLIDALGRMRDLPGWVAWVAGGVQRPKDRELLAGLIRRAEENGVSDRVKFLGQRSDVPALLAAADIHCQPNTGPEPFGIAFVEALYAGLPVVTTRMGGAVEVVDETCGVLVPPGDAGALAGVLSSLVGDPEARRSLARHGPGRARSLCDPPAVMARLADLVESVVRSGRGRARRPATLAGNGP